METHPKYTIGIMNKLQLPSYFNWLDLMEWLKFDFTDEIKI